MITRIHDQSCIRDESTDPQMITEKFENVDKIIKKVPEWLNNPLWSAKPTSDSVDGSYTIEEHELLVVERDETIETFASSSNSWSSEGERSSRIENDTNHGEGKIDPDDQKNKHHICDQHSSDPVLPSLPGHSSSSPNFQRCLPSGTRLDRYSSALSKEVINLTELQSLASQGIPDYGGLRATVWKLLLYYLPRNRDLWESELARKRSKYAALKEELLMNPTEVTRRMEETSRQNKLDGRNDEDGQLRRHEIPHGDHPLSLGETSVWNQFFQDIEMAEQIERDVKRTHPDMIFFSGESASSLENQEALKRILFIFAKLHPSTQYVQGMNEVLAPLYYVFKTDPDEGNEVNAEADAFFCLVELLSNFLDHFCQKLDNSTVGIRSTMARMTDLLKKHDEELWRHLDATTKVNPQFYAFRWITTLFTQEFSFLDCLRIWDSLLSNRDGPLEILLRICCAMLICIRSQLLAGDFTSNLKLLQHYPSVDINHLLHMADELKNRT